MKVDPHGILCQAARLGNLAPRAALEQSQQERLAISFRQILNRGDRFDCLEAYVGGVPVGVPIVERHFLRAAPDVIERPAPRDRGNPAPERRRLTQGSDHRPRVHEYFLREIRSRVRRYARQENGVDVPSVAAVQIPERIAIAALRRDDDWNMVGGRPIQRDGDQTLPFDWRGIVPMARRRGRGGFVNGRSSIDAMTEWFARPVLHVSSVEASLRFYVDRLGFTVPWRYEEDGRRVSPRSTAQSCALILSDQWPEKAGKGLMFISLNVEPETHEAEVAAVDALRAELEARGVRSRTAAGATGCWWSRISTATSFSSPIRTSRRNDYSAISRMTLHGLPAAKAPSGTSRVTTLPAPITARDPIRTPGRMIAPPPTQTSEPISSAFRIPLDDAVRH